MRVDDAVGAVAVHGVRGLPRDAVGGHLRGRLPDGHQQRRVVDRRPAHGHRDVPAARVPVRLGGGVRSSGSSTSCACRRPSRSRAWTSSSTATLIYPEMGVVTEQIVEPDGTLVEIGGGLADPPTARARAGEDGQLMLSFVISVVSCSPCVGGRCSGPCARSAGATEGGGPCRRSLTARPSASRTSGRQARRRLGRLHPAGGLREVRGDHDVRSRAARTARRARARPAPTWSSCGSASS